MRLPTQTVPVRYEGFTVHAGVTVAASDREGRERLCRYGARPPFSLERLSVLDDGRIAYRTKYPGPHGHTHRVVTPLEFMARIAALAGSINLEMDAHCTRGRVLLDVLDAFDLPHA